jgi:holo-[acyl-carrier protein] synthase
MLEESGMIIGIGVDLVDMRRIEALHKRFGERFIQKIFTKNEQTYANEGFNPLRAYANRFAAKEAAVKALGTGFRDGITWHDIETLRTPSGAPTLVFHHLAFQKFSDLLAPGQKGVVHVSFSDELPYSTAFVILSAVTG